MTEYADLRAQFLKPIGGHMTCTYCMNAWFKTEPEKHNTPGGKLCPVSPEAQPAETE